MRYGIQTNRVRKLVVAASLVATTLLTITFPLTALAAESHASFKGLYYPGRKCTQWVKPAPADTKVDAEGTASLAGKFVIEEGRWGKINPQVTTQYKHTVSPPKQASYRLCYQNVNKDTSKHSNGSLFIETK